jgi:hypothetical protein
VCELARHHREIADVALTIRFGDPPADLKQAPLADVLGVWRLSLPLGR